MKPRSSGISLGKFILLWTLLAIGVMAALSVLLSLNAAEERIWSDAEKLGQSTVSQVSLLAERSIGRDEALLREFLVDSVSDPRVEVLGVVNHEGVISFATRERLKGIPLLDSGLVSPDVIEAFSDKGSFFGLSSRSGYRVAYLQSFAWPPERGKIRSNRIGYAVVVLDLTESLHQTRAAIMADNLKVSASFLGITSLLFVLFYAWLKSPLNDLTRASRHFSNGDFQFRIGKIRIKELGELTLAFETMAKEISAMFTRVRASESQLKELIEYSPIGIIAFDHNSRATYVNKEFCNISGIPRSTVLSFTAAELEAEFQRLGYEKPMRLEAANELKDSTGQSDLPLQHDEIIELHLPEIRVLSRSIVQFPSERLNISSVHYFQNITSLTLLDRMKSEFMSTAAHELRTPMSIISGYAELIRFGANSEEQQADMISTIHEQAISMTHLLNELLDLARIEAGAGKMFDFRRGKLGTLIEGIASSFIMKGDLRKLRLAPIPALPDLDFDSEKMAQAIKNCLSNAYKFSSHDTDVWLKVEVVQIGGRSALVIRITDQGIGMTSEQLERIFEKFYRADSTGKVPGTGLGMSLVKEIIECHGGTVQVESTFGVGTTVSLFLLVP